MKTYDPRTKLHILLMFLIMTLIAWNPVSIISYTITAGLLIYLLWDGFHKIITEAIILLAVEVLAGLIFIIFTPTGFGLYLTYKLLLYTVISLMILNTMKQGEILDGVAYGFGVRTRTAKVILLILDYFPKVFREKRRSRQAQRAKGVDPDSGSIIDRLRKDMLLVIPNLKYAYSRSRKQYAAMNKKKYYSISRRNSIYEMKLTSVDKLITVAFLVLMELTIAVMIIF